MMVGIIGVNGIPVGRWTIPWPCPMVTQLPLKTYNTFSAVSLSVLPRKHLNAPRITQHKPCFYFYYQEFILKVFMLTPC